tara:strand:+ start:136 stop:342 length:207 start_codon:yes stop_codon:yes gene_type:complete
MLGEDKKVWQAIWRITNWKIFACSIVFDNIFFRKADAIGRFFLCALMVRLCRLVQRFLISFRFEESKT